MAENKKIILFPNFQTALEEESYEALSKNDFATALDRLNTLLSHQIESYKINVSKIICLIQLKRYSEAISFCETILQKNDAHYYDYFDYLLIALYEVGDYYTLIQYYNEEKAKNSIPADREERFQTFYLLSVEMNNSEIAHILKQFDEAHKEVNDVRQWKLLNDLRKISSKVPEQFNKLLTNINTHPVIKTFIFQWLQESEAQEEVAIEKFGDVLHIVPKQFVKMEEHPTYLKTLQYFVSIEQENPTLFALIEKLLHYYLYVIYPVMYLEEEAYDVAQTIIHIAKVNLGMPSTLQHEEHLTDFIKHITLCHQLYMNVVGE